MSLSLSRSEQKRLIALLGLWALHGIIAFWQFVTLPSNNADFPSNLSLPRLFMSGVLLFWIVFNLALILFTAQNAPWLVKRLHLLKKPQIRDGLLVLVLLVVFLGISLVVLRSLLGPQLVVQYAPYIDRLFPVAGLMTSVSLEMMIVMAIFHLRDQAESKRALEIFAVRLFVILTALVLVAAIISFTGLGIMQGYKGDWSRGLPAVPLLEWQIVLALLFSLGMVLFEARGKLAQSTRLDLWICVAIWLGAVVLWLGQPVVPNASALKPHEPNFEIYPFIDSQTYDEFSQSVLIGNGFGRNQIPQRPLYAVFLVFIHVLVGQDYNDMIVLQSLFFALFPVLLYLFGREFLGRPLGISVALLAILRDHTSNLVSPFTGNISYSKLYLSEIPTAIFLILFLLVGVRWIKAGFPIFWGFLLGGILGIGMLIRTQVIVALPVIILFAFLVEPKKISALMKNALLMFLGVVLVVSPWLWRNWRMTGELIFDSPESQTINLALRYSRLNGVEPDVMPQAGESSAEYNDRLKETAFDAISSNPWGAVKGVANFFLNHAVNNVLLFPLRDNLQSLDELWVPAHAFWERWEGTPNFIQTLLLAFYVFLFGLGLTTAWVWNGWLGFLPLALNLIYNLWTSLALLSGQRFMLTMDWSIYLYYMIGLFTLLKSLLFTLESGRAIVLKWHENHASSVARPAVEKKWWQFVLVGALFFGVGLSLPLSEMVFPRKYPAVAEEKILKDLMDSAAFEQTGLNPACLQKMAGEDRFDIVQGRVLYPRYYVAGDGEKFTDSAGYKITDQGRLVFDMIGQINGRIIFPMPQSPDFFPNAADAALFSDDDGTPWFVSIRQGDVERFYISESFDRSVCE